VSGIQLPVRRPQIVTEGLLFSPDIVVAINSAFRRLCLIAP
jgi:hypothetical protein